ncbi:MAG: rod shape-determining protein [Oscillospiraceae bacterium]|nr:rod shape-determining protein [Oscillospiraceae bacterium]
MRGIDLGIDLGSSNIVIYDPRRGVVLDEPSVMTVDAETGEMIAIGREALPMIGRTPPSLKTIQPIRKGVISDYKMTERMIQHYMRRVCAYKIFRPRVSLAMPTAATGMEQRLVQDAISTCGVRQVVLVDQPVAAAVGAGLDVGQARGSMTLNIGGGTTSIALLTLGGIASVHAIRVGGDNFDEAIIRYMRYRHNHWVGPLTAERIKREIGCRSMAIPSDTFPVWVPGRSTETGLPGICSIPAGEIHEAIEDLVITVGDAVVTALEDSLPELAGDVVAHGIMLTGRMSLMPALRERLEELLGVSCRIAGEPGSRVAAGTTKAAAALRELRSGALLNPRLFESEEERELEMG